ncbi:MAG: anthranilate phosphoribosyltransferase [Sandaracinaceae bacterium]
MSADDPVRVALACATSRADLSAAQMEAALEAILAGAVSPARIAGLAVALHMKGETTTEIVAAARVLRRRAAPWPLGATQEIVLDTCGTGGDGASTFNISTTAAIVVAACGVKVAKHGNRAVSSRSGSADVLEALGVALGASPEDAADDLRELGIAFLFAPAFHAALRHAAEARRELGMRTFFNLLGPLANPAGASHQLMGVYDGSRTEPLARALVELGAERAWVVHGIESGLDEVDPSGPTAVAMADRSGVTTRVLEPSDFGLPAVSLSELRGGDAMTNAAITRAVLAGQPGATRTATLINAAAALSMSGAEHDLRAAVDRARAAIDGGAAAAVLRRWAARRGAA